jgi:hypothetical protein
MSYPADSSTNEYDEMTDEELMARVNRSRAISRGERELDLVHGLAMLQPGGNGHGNGFTPEQHMMAFMNIFHPEQAPQSIAQARAMIQD